jgi:polyhydroxybutyrate depolymerase
LAALLAALAGCRAATRESATLMIVVDGAPRIAIVHVPPHVAARPALILDLHGSSSTAAGQQRFSNLDAAADTNGFVVAYPQATIAAGDGFDWNIPGVPLANGAAVPAGAANDEHFLVQLIDTLEQRYGVDPKRVYATGMSGGGRMASQLGCDLSTVVAAVAPVAGLRFPAPCTSQRAAPMIAFHGTADPIDRYDGNGSGHWTYSVPVAADRWAAHDGCSAAPVRSQPAPTVELATYCSAVELYSIAGEGHEWPGGPPMPARITSRLGPQSDAIDANATMWQFFAQHPLP